MSAPVCASWKAIRAQAFALVGGEPDWAAKWWAGLSDTRRQAVLGRIDGALAFMSGHRLDALPPNVQAAVRAAYTARLDTFTKLREEFDYRGRLCTATL